MPAAATRHIETLLPAPGGPGAVSFSPAGIATDTGLVQATAGGIGLVSAEEVANGIVVLSPITANWQNPRRAGMAAVSLLIGSDNPYWIATTSGIHTVTAVVDPLNIVPETDDTNNSKSTTLTIGSPQQQLPDLTIVSASWAPAAANGDITIGNEITWGAIIQNIGLGATPAGSGQPGNHRIGWYLDTTVPVDANLLNWEDTYNGPMPPNATQQLFSTGGPSGKSTWTAAGTPGPHQILVWVDGPQLIAESNENNNTLLVNINLVAVSGGGGGGGTGTRDWKLQPFPSTDPFNTPRGADAAFDSRPIISTGGVNINTIFFGTTINGSGETTVQQGDTAEAHHCDIQPDGRTVWGFTAFIPGTHTVVDIRTGNSYNCIAPGNPGAYERATKMSGMAGPLRKYECQNAVNGDVHAIKHCIGLGIAARILSKNFVWPAFAQDSFAGGNLGFMPEGSFMAIPTGTVMPGGLSSLGQAIWWALHDYGAYAVDATGAVNPSDPASGTLTVVEGEAGADALLNGVRGSQISSILGQVRWCTNASQAQIGGPGVRLAPLAPAV